MAAIRTAVGRLGDVETREARALVPSTGGWQDIFNQTFVESFLGTTPAALPQTVVPLAGRTRRPRLAAESARAPEAARA